MNDLGILRVQIIKRVQKLIAPQTHLLERKGPTPSRDHLSKVVAGYVLHYEKGALNAGEVIADARQCRMMQSSQQPRFTLKLLAQFLLDKQRLFQRHSCIQPLIDRFVNSTHTALPELPND